MKQAYNLILSNLVFITRIPVPLRFQYCSDSRNVKYFPLVGVILGMILLVISVIATYLFGALPAAALTVLSLVALTGGIHLDGLADLSDALLSYKDSDRMIEIMKDSHIGAMGVIVLCAMLLLKTSVVATLLDQNAWVVIFLFPVWGRLAIVNACYFGKPIQQSRLGAGFIGNMKFKEFAIIHFCYMILIVFGLVIVYRSICTALCISMGVFLLQIAMSFYFTKKVTTRIGGISGDTLGAICELSEVVSMLIAILELRLCTILF